MYKLIDCTIYSNISLTAARFKALQSFTDLNSMYKDLLQPKAVHDLLWPVATT